MLTLISMYSYKHVNISILKVLCFANIKQLLIMIDMKKYCGKFKYLELEMVLHNQLMKVRKIGKQIKR